MGYSEVGAVARRLADNADQSLQSVNISLSLPGGRWVPDWCQPRHRIAVLIPFRNRQRHLRIFIPHMRQFLQRQLVDYTIYVVEQVT